MVLHPLEICWPVVQGEHSWLQLQAVCLETTSCISVMNMEMKLSRRHLWTTTSPEEKSWAYGPKSTDSYRRRIVSSMEIALDGPNMMLSEGDESSEDGVLFRTLGPSTPGIGL